MHAFMALFFYELVRDQIVFIWHEWATVVVHRWSLFLSAGPCLQHFLDDGEKCSYWPSDVKDRSESFIYVYLFIYLCFMYLFIYLCCLTQDLSSIIAYKCFFVSLHHIWPLLSIGKLQRLILHFPVCDKLLKAMQSAAVFLSLMYICVHNHIALFKGGLKKNANWKIPLAFEYHLPQF